MGAPSTKQNVTVDIHSLDEVDGRLDWVHETVRTANLVVAKGREVLRNLLSNYGSAPSVMALGTASTSPHDGDVALEVEVFRNAVTRVILDPAVIKFQMHVDTDQANGYTIAELGLFAAAPMGAHEDQPGTVDAAALVAGTQQLFARAVLPDPIAKTASVSFTITWEIPIESTEI